MQMKMHDVGIGNGKGLAYVGCMQMCIDICGVYVDGIHCIYKYVGMDFDLDLM